MKEKNPEKEEPEALSKFKPARVRMSLVNVLAQPRKTFEEIDELALSIASIGQIHPAVITRLSREEVDEYLNIINKLWGTAFKTEDMVREQYGFLGSKTRYNILVSGERRYRAILKNGSKYISASVGSIDAFRALKIQFQENIHVPVPPAEEAESYKKLFQLIREKNPGLTIRAFAGKVGRSTSKISDSLRYCELPQSLRDMVENGTVPYGFGLELWKLHKAGVSEDELRSLAVGAVIEQMTVKKLEERVRDYLLSRSSGQVALFTLAPEEEQKRRRRVVDEQFVRYLWGSEQYIRRARSLEKQGLLIRGNGEFSDGSPRRKVVATAKILHDFSDNSKILSGKEKEDIEKSLSDSLSNQSS
mgnify:FL=1